MGETYDQCKKEAERVPFKVVNEGGYPRVQIDDPQIYSTGDFCNDSAEDEEDS